MHAVVYIDRSTIRDGKLEELKAAAERLSAFVRANMPRLISYGFYFDDGVREMTVVAVHPDSESLEFHMKAGADEFAKFSDLLDLSRIDVYGAISESVVARLQHKARSLGSGVVVVHDRYTGFARQGVGAEADATRSS